MGAAMAGAACDVIEAHFNETGRNPDYYDVIATGDLGDVGKALVKNMPVKPELYLIIILLTAALRYSTMKHRTHTVAEADVPARLLHSADIFIKNFLKKT